MVVISSLVMFASLFTKLHEFCVGRTVEDVFFSSFLLQLENSMFRECFFPLFFHRMWLKFRINSSKTCL